MSCPAFDEGEARSGAAGTGRGRFLLIDGRDWRIRMASRGARAALGHADGALGGLSFLELAPEIGEAAWRRLVRRLEGGAEAAAFETRLRLADGSLQATRVRLEALEDGGSLCLHAALDAPAGEAGPGAGWRLNAALLRSVIDTAPDAIVTIDERGRIESFSPAAERMFGYRAAEVVGRNVSMLMPEPYRSQHDDYIGRYLETGEKRIIGIGRSVIAQHKSGATFPIELAVGEVRTAEDHVFTGFIRDISDRVAAQARANKLQDELNHVGRLTAMGEIASMIVHELNQPLTAIANFGEAAKRLVARGGEEAGRAAGFMEKSVAQAHRASEMIRRLRSFVSRGPGELEPIAVNEVVRDAARLALIGAADQDIRTRFELAEGLPEVSADRIQVQQVVVNLIRNGIEAMLEAGAPAGGPASERRLGIGSAPAGDGGVEVWVADTGPGVAPEVAGELFTPFATTKKGGMGIGLSVSKSIVEAHGGRIRVEPNAPRGSRFVFTLPGRAAGGGQA